VVEITDPNKPFYSHRHTATSILRNTLGENGEPLVKESVERYILGHKKKARTTATAGNGLRRSNPQSKSSPTRWSEGEASSSAHLQQHHREQNPNARCRQQKHPA
jgi:hypothetical protein